MYKAAQGQSTSTGLSSASETRNCFLGQQTQNSNESGFLGNSKGNSLSSAFLYSSQSGHMNGNNNLGSTNGLETSISRTGTNSCTPVSGNNLLDNQYRSNLTTQTSGNIFLSGIDLSAKTNSSSTNSKGIRNSNIPLGNSQNTTGSSLFNDIQSLNFNNGISNRGSNQNQKQGSDSLNNTCTTSGQPYNPTSNTLFGDHNLTVSNGDNNTKQQINNLFNNSLSGDSLQTNNLFGSGLQTQQSGLLFNNPSHQQQILSNPQLNFNSYNHDLNSNQQFLATTNHYNANPEVAQATSLSIPQVENLDYFSIYLQSSMAQMMTQMMALAMANSLQNQYQMNKTGKAASVNNVNCNVDGVDGKNVSIFGASEDKPYYNLRSIVNDMEEFENFHSKSSSDSTKTPTSFYNPFFRPHAPIQGRKKNVPDFPSSHNHNYSQHRIFKKKEDDLKFLFRTPSYEIDNETKTAEVSKRPQISNNSHREAQSLNHNSFKQSRLAPEDMIPKLNKSGYYTVPSWLILSRMSEEQLSRVKNFAIYNDFGSIKFEEPVDLRGLDLGEIISIGYKTAEIYPESFKNPPKQGEGLKKPAIITFFDWDVPKKYLSNLHEYKKKLREWSRSMNTVFLGLDLETKELSIRAN